jgi:hypothetical protein
VHPDGLRRTAAGVFTGPANLGADPAMFVAIGMARAFITAGPARIGAGGEDLHCDIFVGSSVPRSQHSGRDANIRAIEVQPDTLAQFVERRLAETSIGASSAALRAIET